MKGPTKDELINKVLTGPFVGSSVVLIEMLGLVPAIMLRQISVFCNYHERERDGHYWTYNSIPSWSRVTGISVDKVRRALEQLAKDNLILRSDAYNKMPHDRTLWYAVNDEGLRKRVREYLNTPVAPPSPSSHEQAEQSKACEAFRIGAGNP